MPFPLPSPEELTRQQEALFEAELRTLAEARGMAVEPAAIARAVRAPHGMVGILARVNAMLLYGAHLHLRWWGDQYFPDTAESAQLERHGSIWGVVRRPATRALGRAVFSGTPGTVIPLGLALHTPAGALVETIEDGRTIAGGGTIDVAVRAIEAGPEANAAAGAVLPTLAMLPGLDPQRAVLDAGGLAGGAAVETDAALEERLVTAIRARGRGGNQYDYPQWVQNAFAASHVATKPAWVGLGTVGVVVAMGTRALPRVPTSEELAAIAAHLETSPSDARPVTAEVLVLAVILEPLALTITLDPDDVLVRQAVDAAVRGFLAREATIGGTIYRSRLSEAISAAAGEYRHTLTVPAGDVVAAPRGLAVPGAITWVAP